MFGVGLPEMAVIAVVAVMVFGPDRLPDLARQAGRFIRELRKMANSARDDLRTELGPEFADLELRDLDPREIVRKHLAEAMADDEDSDAKPKSNPDVDADDPVDLVKQNPGKRPLSPGERPPWDPDAT